jgi:hypothetical protein
MRGVVQNVAYGKDGRPKAITVVSKANAIGKAMRFLKLLDVGPTMGTRQEMAPRLRCWTG